MTRKEGGPDHGGLAGEAASQGGCRCSAVSGVTAEALMVAGAVAGGDGAGAQTTPALTLAGHVILDKNPPF